MAIGGLFVVDQFVSDLELNSLSHWGRLAVIVSAFGSWLIFSFLVGLVVGWDCWRRERIRGSTGWIWPIAVGLCGWFGWMAYVSLRPLPARLPNRQRLAARPEPNLSVGTEIFA